MIECRSHPEEKDNADAIASCKIKLFSATRWTLRHVGFIRTDQNLGHCFTLWELTLDVEKI